MLQGSLFLGEASINEAKMSSVCTAMRVLADQLRLEVGLLLPWELLDNAYKGDVALPENVVKEKEDVFKQMSAILESVNENNQRLKEYQDRVFQ